MFPVCLLLLPEALHNHLSPPLTSGSVAPERFEWSPPLPPSRQHLPPLGTGTGVPREPTLGTDLLSLAGPWGPETEAEGPELWAAGLQLVYCGNPLSPGGGAGWLVSLRD